MLRFPALLAFCVLLLAPAAHAVVDYTDTWWNPAEAGWGINLTQQQSTIYVTFYVYDIDGRATWYAALLSRDGTGERFTGPLNRTNGTWLGAPWQGYSITPVGTATFIADSSTGGTLSYTVDAVTVTKSIQRITLAPLNVAGVYIGGVSGRRSGCQTSGTYADPIQFDVLQSTTSGEIRIDQISASTGQLVCRMEGTAVQTGKVLTIPAASYACVDGWEGTARVYNLRPTPAGFEAQWFSDGGNGCTESGQFSGVTQNP